MAITTLAQLLAAKRQVIEISYTTSRTTQINGHNSMLGVANNGTTGVLAGTSTTTGVVPTDATAGFVPLESFGSGTGYLSDADLFNDISCHFGICDLLWKGGAYAFNASTTGQTPTSYSSRVPGGTDFTGTEIWYEQVTSGTGNQNVAVTYIDQSGNAGHTTGTVLGGAGMAPGQMTRLPLQAGDTGVQGITGVVGTTATVGTFNILVLRPIWRSRLQSVNMYGDCGIDKTGMPIIFPGTALYLTLFTDSASSGLPCFNLGIVSG